MSVLVKLLFTLPLFLLYSQVLFCADWFAYIPNDGANTIVPINLSNNVAGSPILNDVSASAPTHIALTPDGTKAYVTNSLSNNVTPINLTTHTIGPLISTGTSPFAIAITPDGTKVYVTNNDSNDLTIITIASNASINSMPPFIDSPCGIAITPDGQTAYIAFQNMDFVMRFDIATNTQILPPIPIASPSNIAITPNGTKAYVTNAFADTVTPIDLTSNPPQPQAPILVGSLPFSIAITSDGTRAFVTNQGDDTVTPIEIATDIPGAPIMVGGTPYGIAITPDSKTAYVSIFCSDNVNPIDLTMTPPLPQTPIPMVSDGAPYGVAITPDQAPIASFVSVPALSGSPTLFDASSSTTLVGSIINYAWDFGDGSTLETSSSTTNYIYSTPGAYTVTLVVTNSAGTSTVQIFTGQTMSNNGGPSAIAQQQISIQSALVATTTTLSIFSNPIHLVATVNSALGVPTGGFVTFFDGGAPIGFTELNSNGQAILSLFNLSVGNHTIVASYSGSGNFTASTSNAVVLVIKPIDPPTQLRGFQTFNRFATQTDWITRISWNPPTSGVPPVLYRIYRDASLKKRVAEVPAQHKLDFVEHNRRHRSSNYFIVSVDEWGRVSVPAKVIVHN